MIDKLHALSRDRFGYLERFALQRSVDPRGGADWQLEIDQRSGTSSDSPRLALSFEGVRGLRIGNLQGLLFHVFEVRSIVDAQLEDLNYTVEDIGEHAISFQCKAFTVRIAEVT
ncbi:MAG TPA: hypothetical protein VGP63_08100 [Planctomycetaceae bacterium]|jgi:hypothetical protein|nr:hypothetical protein [Planctomycetaceae bacterium]